MKKLKTKVFVLIFLILSVFTTGIVFAYNAQLYRQEYKAVEMSLSQTNKEFRSFDRRYENRPDGDFQPPEEQGEFENIRFLDRTVYTVLLDGSNAVSEVICHSADSASTEEITALSNEIIASGEKYRIGNLYAEQYSYSYEEGSSIVIVDNASAMEELRGTLLVSFVLYALLEVIIFLVSRILSLWIAKPVAESFEKQKQFIADASHELKTPLAVIIASADALESNPSETKWLENIKSESDRMNRLIADLLDLAKSEEVDDKSQFTEGNLSKTVEKATLTFEGVMFEKGVALKDDIEQDIMLNMNKYRIIQLMSILLDNAVKHSDTGGEIKVSLKKDKDIVLKVTNKGEGIPKGEEEKIFERFYRADESRNRNENRYGLGLAIAKNICLSHGGEISAKSENGFTTFKVIFKQ